MTEVRRTHSDDPHFIGLIKLLDAHLAERDGDQHAFYDQFNKVDKIRHVVTVFREGRPAACGAIKMYAPGVMEIKRMFTRPEFRGLGLATDVLRELETWAKELGVAKCILETGKRQPDAIALYEKNGYRLVPNYSPYEGVANSVCYEKGL